MIKVCSRWIEKSVKWTNANWTFSDCQLVDDICAIWGRTGVRWKDANWRWSECPSRKCEIWSLTNVRWKDANWRWIDCQRPAPITGNPPGVDATLLIPPWMEETWNPYHTGSYHKRKKLIELICKVKGESFNEKKEKEIKDYKVVVGDIRMVVQAVRGINIEIK